MMYSDVVPRAATRRGIFLAAVTVLAALAPGCRAADAQPSSPPVTGRGAPNVLDGALGDGDPSPELSTAELRAVLSDPTVVVLDARPPAEYAVSHIPGARSVPGKPNLAASAYTSDASAVIKMIPDRSRRLVLYCNGLYCGRSKRFAAELRANGYTDVRRYQLGIPGWRALGGVAQVEKSALSPLLAHDATSVLIDAREPGARPRLANAKPISVRDAATAKDDGRLPMNDHNTRIFVVGDSGTQARAVAEAIVRDAFHNVAFFDGGVSDLPELTTHAP
jgi:rhodanese-related sulfurtransferase